MPHFSAFTVRCDAAAAGMRQQQARNQWLASERDSVHWKLNRSTQQLPQAMLALLWTQPLRPCPPVPPKWMPHLCKLTVRSDTAAAGMQHQVARNQWRAGELDSAEANHPQQPPIAARDVAAAGDADVHPRHSGTVAGEPGLPPPELMGKLDALKALVQHADGLRRAMYAELAAVSVRGCLPP